MHTLQHILGQPMDSSMTMQQIEIDLYILFDIAKKLTAPLLVAYSAMININARLKTNNMPHDEEALPLQFQKKFIVLSNQKCCG
jgi:hypothetical protein